MSKRNRDKRARSQNDKSAPIPPAPLKRFSQMTEIEITDYFKGLALAIESVLPPGEGRYGKTMFFLVAAESQEAGTAQYVSNIQRESAIKLLRETADRLERRETVERQG